MTKARFGSLLRNLSISLEVSMYLLCWKAGKMRHKVHDIEITNPALGWERTNSYMHCQPDVSNADVSSLDGYKELMRSFCREQEGWCWVFAHQRRSPLCNPLVPSSASCLLLSIDMPLTLVVWWESYAVGWLAHPVPLLCSAEQVCQVLPVSADNCGGVL